jgi:hypothetical protein
MAALTSLSFMIILLRKSWLFVRNAVLGHRKDEKQNADFVFRTRHLSLSKRFHYLIQGQITPLSHCVRLRARIFFELGTWNNPNI